MKQPPFRPVLLREDLSDSEPVWEVGDDLEGDIGYGDGYDFVTSGREG